MVLSAIEAAGVDRRMLIAAIEAADIDRGNRQLEIEAHGFTIEVAGVDRETFRRTIEAADIDRSMLRRFDRSRVHRSWKPIGQKSKPTASRSKLRASIVKPFDARSKPRTSMMTAEFLCKAAAISAIEAANIDRGATAVRIKAHGFTIEAARFDRAAPESPRRGSGHWPAPVISVP